MHSHLVSRRAKPSRSPSSKHKPKQGAEALEEIHLVPIEQLRPTQVAVGMRTVTYKRRKIEDAVGRRKRLEKLLGKRPIPAVRGPGGELYIIDHHHFGLALWQAQIPMAYTRVIDDLSHCDEDDFWHEMEAVGRLYPYDEQGRRVSPHELPAWLHSLRHDPYRDIAWEIREAGGFDKVATPYAEFRWADFLRERIPLPQIRKDYESALNEALRLARTRAAAHLPGYLGRMC